MAAYFLFDYIKKLYYNHACTRAYIKIRLRDRATPKQFLQKIKKYYIIIIYEIRKER
jgi:hypothetical protein